MRHYPLLEPEGTGDFVFLASQAGDTSSATVEVRFARPVFSPGGDYALGVTIKVNGSTATISSATRQSDTAVVHYVLSVAFDANDVVTWEYTGGDLRDANDSSKALATVAAQTVTNLVGTHFWFDVTEDSGHARDFEVMKWRITAVYIVLVNSSA